MGYPKYAKIARNFLLSFPLVHNELYIINGLVNTAKLDEFPSVLMYYVFTNIVCTRRASQVMHVTDWCYQRENYSKL